MTTRVDSFADLVEAVTEPRRRNQGFEPGDLVVDREELPLFDDIPEALALVLYRRASNAKHAAISVEDGATVASVNPEYPADDDVYRVAFIRTLDADVPGWRDWPGDIASDRRLGFRDELLSFQREWGVIVDTYDYPSSRLYGAGHMRLPQTRLDDNAALDEAVNQTPVCYPSDDE